MINKIITTAITISFLLFTGCGQKVPEMDSKGSNNNISEDSALTGETVSIDENRNLQGNEYGGKNSSGNGFQSLYFDFGGYAVASSMENAILKNTNVAKNANGSKIKIEGNCDEFGTDEYNYALGLKRAKSVKESMVSQGINRNQMVMVSFGESNPICSAPTDSCYEKNRRVDLRLAR